MILMSDFMGLFHLNFLKYLTTGNVILDSIITYLFVTFSGMIVNINIKRNFENLKHFYYESKYNEILLEGKQIDFLSRYSECASSSGIYSDSYRAIFKYITNNIFDTERVHFIKEVYSRESSSYYNRNNESENENENEKEMFVVNSCNPFLLEDDIYCCVQKDDEHNNTNNDEKDKIKMERITIKIYSYERTMKEIYDFLNRIKKEYLESIKEKRLYKRFIYSLEKTDYETSNRECWSECEFESNRKFENTFFEKKKEIIEQIDFFINNKDWYDKMGIPYNLGICLHGLPGTGKTSFVKALANYTDRNIIQLSLKLIETKQQLVSFFYEKIYTETNKTPCEFSNKIILLEDIDCSSDILFQRDENDETNKNKINNTTYSVNSNNSTDISKQLVENIKVDNKTKNKVTLDDVLNLFDGVCETPGRIIIITTNYYSKLDTAFTRPGRFDITIEMKKANTQMICDLFFMFFKKRFPKKNIPSIKNYEFTPAELVNMYLYSNKRENEFIENVTNNIDI